MTVSVIIAILMMTTSAFFQAPPASATAVPVATTSIVSSSGATSQAAGAADANFSSLDWTEYTGPGSTGQEGWNFSPQTQIDASDVGDLAVSYTFAIPSILGTSPSFQSRFPGLQYSTDLEGSMAPVLSANGTGYVVTNGLSVYAFDLATGHLTSTDLPAMDWASYAKEPWAPSGPPGHLHSANMVDGVIWVNGFGCQLQGWDAATGALRANLTGLCNDIPGDYSPYAGWGQYYSFGDSAIQVDVKYNEILYYDGGSAEGTGGGRFFVEACSLSAALDPSSVGSGTGCEAGGGACTTPAGGVCSAGSTMLWRTFFMPPMDGSDPGWTTDLCETASIWVAGVPCSALPTSIIEDDWQDPSLAPSWNGTDISPSTGMSNSWGQYALDDQDGLVFLGTSQSGADWNGSLRPGPDLLANSIVALNLTSGKVAWADKSIARDLNDEDCDLNTIFAPVQGEEMVLKACKSGVVYGIDALTGQPRWILDTTMPDYKTLGPSTSPLSQPFECVAGNSTSCDYGAEWDKIYQMYDAGTLKMQGTNPDPHGYVSGAPYRASHGLDPLNMTEMTEFDCPVGTNSECEALAGVGETPPCSAVANTTLCPGLAATGKPGFVEAPYLMESENAFDGRYLYVVVMDGPMEQDYIGDVGYKGQSGIVFGTNLYFSGQMPTNATVLKIDPTDGDILWNYTRQIYYRGGLLVTGGMVISEWPDGQMVFLSADTGAVLRTIDLGVPLLAPLSIAPDVNGMMHILIDAGGTNHPVLGEAGLHGPLGHSYVMPGDVISISLASTSGQSTSTTSASTSTASAPPPTGVLPGYWWLIAVVAAVGVVGAALAISRRRRR